MHRKEVIVMYPDNNSSVTPLFPNDSNVSVSPCHDCPFAVCNPLRVERMERKLRNAIAYLAAWNDGAYIVTVDSDDFDILNHCYDLRSVIAGLSVILHEALEIPLGDVPAWENQYPVVLPGDTPNERQKGSD